MEKKTLDVYGSEFPIPKILLQDLVWEVIEALTVAELAQLQNEIHFEGILSHLSTGSYQLDSTRPLPFVVFEKKKVIVLNATKFEYSRIKHLREVFQSKI